MTYCQKPLKINPATISETTPIRIVAIQPMGSRPGSRNRPSAPTIAPTMMSHTHCMPSGSPTPAGRKPGRRARQRPLLDELPPQDQEQHAAQHAEEEPTGLEGEQENEREDVHQAAAVAARSSRRSSLISSRSFAAYSKRSSSAAANISSSSSMTSRSSSLGAMPSTSLRPRLRFDLGTVGDSSVRNSAMSETPFTIVSAVIPCSSL